MKKADNKPVKDDETLEFEVIEFSKDSKRIIVSHTNVWKGAEKATKETDANNKDKARKNASKAVKKINQTSEKTTLGELGALAELRAQLEKQENAPAEKPAKAKAVEVKKEEVAETTAGATLKSLSGVGPAMEKRIIALGVNSLEDLKALNADVIAANVEKDSKISAEQWNKWIEEANSL
jgi:predicted flap endonuclease-1-like 5' DNA nuclease